MAAVLSGDRSAFAPLVQQYQVSIYNFAYRYTHDREEASDITQEVFLRAFRFLNRYDARFSFKNWLYSIATNVCHDWARKRTNRSRTVPLPDPSDESWIQPANELDDDPALSMLKQEDTEALEKAIAQLPDEYRTCLILFYIEGLSQKEMSKILQLPLATIKNRLYRARKQLRYMLEEGDRIEQFQPASCATAPARRTTCGPDEQRHVSHHGGTRSNLGSTGTEK